MRRPKGLEGEGGDATGSPPCSVPASTASRRNWPHPPLARPCKTLQRPTGIQDFEAFFSNPESPNLMPSPPCPKGGLIFFVFFYLASIFSKNMFFWQLPLLTGHTGLQPRRAETPQKSVNPANCSAYLFFLAFLGFASLFCFFSSS